MEHSDRATNLVKLIVHPIKPTLFISKLKTYLFKDFFSYNQEDSDFININMLNRLRFNFAQGYITTQKFADSPDPSADYNMFAKYLKLLRFNTYLQQLARWREIIVNSVVNGIHDGILIDEAFEANNIGIIVVIC